MTQAVYEVINNEKYVLREGDAINNPVFLRNTGGPVRGCYTVSDVDHVWVSDWTIGPRVFSKHGGSGRPRVSSKHGGSGRPRVYILIIMDLSSRFIIAMRTLGHQPSAADVVITLEQVIQDMGVQPRILQTNFGGAYMSTQLSELLASKGITHLHREKKK